MDRKFAVVTGVFCSGLMLTGCVEGTTPGSSRADAAATASAERPAATQLVERDVEAPEVFQKTEAALWDGRPSLGGVWVAHPDVTDPERVIIRNSSNGQTVIGALFRRERENPGPRIQVSSDAAASLGLLAGAPTELSVTALRRTEPPKAEAEPEAAEETSTTLAEAEPVETEALDPVANAAAAIDRAEAEAPTSPIARESDVASAEVAASTAESTEENVALAEVEEAAPQRKSGGFLAGLFGSRNKSSEPLNALGDAATGTAAGTVVTTQAIAGDVPAPTQASARASSSISEPYLQIGIFSVEQNAKDTAAAMRQAGVVPTIYEQESAGKTFWRVVVGPANTRPERSALLRKVKGLGFDDAYAVAR